MSGPEKTFENKVKDHISKIGGWYLKYWGGAKYTKSGIPDLLCGINGYFVAIEVKSDNGRPKPLQLVKIREMRNAGIIAFVLYPDMFYEFKEICTLINPRDYEYASEYMYHFDKKLTDKELEILLK